MSNPSICCITTGAPYNQSRYIALAMPRIWSGDVIIKELGEVLPQSDYYFWTDSGCCHRIETPKEKTAFYAIDSHIRNDRDQWYLEVGRSCKYVFDATTNGDGIQWFAVNGITAHDMPLAYSRDYFWHEELPKKYDVCFIGGRQDDDKRAAILNKVNKHFNVKFVDSNHQPQIYNELERNLINSSRVSLDISPIEGNFLGQRFWNNMGCQSNCVSLKRNIIYKVIHYSYDCQGPYLFNGPEDICDIINVAIKHPIELHGWCDVSKHTYDQRLKDCFLPIVLG